jgi:DNA-binding transcriptional LysR family regulator
MPPPKDLAQFDLNLLRVLDALLVTSGVGPAARRLKLGQPAVSGALARLRQVFNDPLLVRVGNRMTLTPLAEDLRPRVAAIIESIGQAIGQVVAFDPATTARRFRIGATDYACAVLLPEVVSLMNKDAPYATLEIVPCDDTVGDALAVRAVDLVVADRFRTRDLREARVLFTEGFACVARVDHPRLPPEVELDSYLAEGHALIAPNGVVPGNVDHALSQIGRRRKVVLSVPYFMAAAALVAKSDLILTIPRRVARTLSDDGRLRLFDPPTEVPGFDVVCAMHPRSAGDAPIAWFDKLVRAAARRVR